MRWLFCVVLLFLPASSYANVWHEYGQCILIHKTPEGAFDQRVRSEIVRKNNCVKDSSGGLGGFETRFTWATGEQSFVSTVLDRQKNILEVDLNGAPAMILDNAMFVPYHDCYGTAKGQGIEIHCFLGSGMPVEGMSRQRQTPLISSLEPARGFEKVNE